MSVEKIKFKEFHSWKEDGKPTIFKATSLFRWPTYVGKALSSYDHNAIGVTYIYTGDIFILNSKEIRQTITHEIGHVLMGAYHSQNPNDIMYPLIGKKNKNITENDIKALETFLSM